MTSAEFTVPSWEAAKEVPGSELHWGATPPLDLSVSVTRAMDEGRLFVAVTEYADRSERPYCLSGPDGAMYAYPVAPNEAPEGMGRVRSRYVFHSDPPPSLTTLFEIDEDADPVPEILVNTDGGLFYRSHLREKRAVFMVGEPGDGLLGSMLRAAVILHIFFAASGGHPSFDLLPYDKDTLAVAIARVQHVMRWQLSSARTKRLRA